MGPISPATSLDNRTRHLRRYSTAKLVNNSCNFDLFPGSPFLPMNASSKEASYRVACLLAIVIMISWRFDLNQTAPLSPSPSLALLTPAASIS